MTLNVSGGKVCADTPTKFHCSWKGGNPPVSVTLMYKNVSNTSKEEVELNVIPSKSHQTVKCLGIHIAANVSHEKNLTIYYPPKTIEIKADEPFLEGSKGILHCKAINGYPEKYSYRWDPNNNTSQNFTLPQLKRTHNNKVCTCYASNMCNKKRELHKTHWINVEYEPDITASEDVTLIENQASIVNCSAKGNPIPEVRLECRNHSFPSNSPFTFNRRNISDVFCVANAKSTKHGNLTSRKKINILLKYPPQVNIHISNETNNIIINCTAFDGNPDIYEYKLKQKWGNATKNTYTMNVLSINNPSFNNTGTWVCHVSNEDFHVNKSSNYKIPVKPIFSSISNNPKKRNVSIGESVIFKQCFYSHPKSDVKWQKNEKLIDSNKYSTTDYLSSEFPFKGICTSLKIEDIKDNDFGTYRLRVQYSIETEIITFTLKSKEITELSLGMIIGCSVGTVLLLIILGLLAYKCHKIRDVEGTDETISYKQNNMDDANGNISREPDKQCTEISDLRYLWMKQPAVEEQCTEISDLRYLCMKQPDMDGAYINDSQTPGNMDDVHGNISRKSHTVENEYAEISDLRYLWMKQPDMDDAYVNDSQTPGTVENQYAEISHPKYLCMKKREAVEDQYAEISHPKYLCMKKPDMDDAYINDSQTPGTVEVQYAEVSEHIYLEIKQRDMDVAYINVPKFLEITSEGRHNGPVVRKR
eukprot:XP_014777113.1 PREDICTED: uncharacterized protein LOC106874055 [Octopus bimaculoides]